MPNENEIDNTPVPLTDEADAFVNRLEAQVADSPKRYVVTDRFVAEQGTLYQGFAIVRTPTIFLLKKDLAHPPQLKLPVLMMVVALLGGFPTPMNKSN